MLHFLISNHTLNYGNESGMALKPKLTNKSVEQNRGPRNKATLVWLINLKERRQECMVGKRQPFK